MVGVCVEKKRLCHTMLLGRIQDFRKGEGGGGGVRITKLSTI